MSNALDDVHWYPKVQPSKIRRLYESDARGLLDQWLLDEVGFELYIAARALLELPKRTLAGLPVHAARP